MNIPNMNEPNNYIRITPSFEEKLKTCIKVHRILVANNGLASLKFIRSIRKELFRIYNDDHYLQFISMATQEDIDGCAEYLKISDEIIIVPSGPSPFNFGNVDLIVQIAEEENIQAVWPGWGHASENSRLPELLEPLNILFLGPNKNSMWLLGDKIASTIIAQSLDIPVLPWSGNGIRITPEDGFFSEIPNEIYENCTIRQAEDISKYVASIGFPLMLKASSGGGGKGIRKICQDSDHEKIYKQIISEVPNSPICAVKMITRCKHIEIQIVADRYNNIITLFSRDCSLQRRHQKVIEEAPSSSPQHVLAKMETDAIKLAKSVKYIGVGTVEYLYNPETEQYYFLELNPRLQVEHTCTELITHTNLPWIQLQIAVGKKLENIEELLPYVPIIDGRILGSVTGHVIAARILAENAEEGFCPSQGIIESIQFPGSKNVYAYFSITGGKIHKNSDSQYGHIFSHAESRQEATKQMMIALKELSIRGNVPSNCDFLMSVLTNKTFIENKIHTEFIDSIMTDEKFIQKPDISIIVVCGSCCIAYQKYQSIDDAYKNSLTSGLVLKYPISGTLKVEFVYQKMKYCVEISRTSKNSFFLCINECTYNAKFIPLSSKGISVSFKNRLFSCFMNDEIDKYKVSIDSSDCILYKDMDPSILRSPSCGKLINILVPDNTYVEKGTDYCELEIMKMVMALRTSESGIINFVISLGSHVENGTIIAKLTQNQLFTKIQEFKEKIDFETEIPFNYDNIHKFYIKNKKSYISSYNDLVNVMNGFCVSQSYFMEKVKRDVQHTVNYLSQSYFTLSHLKSALDHTKYYLPNHIFQSISRLIYNYSVNISSILYELPVSEILSIVNTHCSVIENSEKRESFKSNISEFVETITQLKNGPKSFKVSKLLHLLEMYIETESHFTENTFECSMNKLLKSNLDLTKILKLVISHTHLKNKNILAIMIIDEISEITKHYMSIFDDVKDVMTRLSNLSSGNHLKVALKAKQFLISCTRPSLEVRHNQLESIILSIIGGTSASAQKVFMDIIHSDCVIYDLLPSFFYNANNQIQVLALEIYIRRAYISHQMICLHHDRFKNNPIVKFYYTQKTSQNTDPICLNHFCIEQAENKKLRRGIFICFSSFEDFTHNFQVFLNFINSNTSHSLDSNLRMLDSIFVQQNEHTVVNICARVAEFSCRSQDTYAKTCEDVISKYMEQLKNSFIRRVTIMLTGSNGELPLFYTYRLTKSYTENKLFRNIEPAEERLIEIKRMNNYLLECIPCENSSIQIYLGKNPNDITEERFFIRTIVRNIGLIAVEPSFDYLVKASEIRLLEALDQLTIITSKLNKQGVSNHIFFHFIPSILIDPSKTVDCMRFIVLRHRHRLEKQKIFQSEMKMVVMLEQYGNPIPLRIVASKESGFELKIELYKEIYDSNANKTILMSIDQGKGNLVSFPIDNQYPLLSIMDKKRLFAHSIGTTYVYDYCQLFNQLVQNGFSNLFNSDSKTNFNSEFSELVLEDESSYELVETKRAPAMNDIGIVCWIFRVSEKIGNLKFQFIIVATDITFQNGSISQKESRLFAAACQLARKNKIPFVFCCCCNGARIGISEEIQNRFKVKWIDSSNYNKGIDYLYIEKKDYENLKNKDVVIVEEIEGFDHLKITDIIGQDNIGVENLKGSGLMAGEMSKTYDETFTISLVTGRAVGIGAYLVRLGRRVVQVENSSIILTGAETLNRVLGRNVYTSHEQLGGTNIMHSNGVSQIVVLDDLEGIKRILKWLSFTLQKQNYLSNFIDPKLVEYPLNESYNDPRLLIFGSKFNSSIKGFFDQSSVFEINTRWASTVITGRAKLGGLPVSFILNDINTIKHVIPADPADSNDVPRECLSIGQVLSPESSFKFSQSIDDSLREGLPLFIFANFRGFSAGMKDMYNQVLKFGATIVDSLRKYNLPIFIYIMPKGELRGGSWAVLDSTINKEYIEMYSCENSRANVLEPSGLVSVKYRQNSILKTIKRLEHVEMVNRIPEADLISHYMKVAELFTCLHDTPKRMLSKGVIKDIIHWKDSRRFFYYRLKRRLLEEKIKIDCQKTTNQVDDIDFTGFINDIYMSYFGKKYEVKSDEDAVKGLEIILLTDSNMYKEKLKNKKSEESLKMFKKIINKNPHLIHKIENILKSIHDPSFS